MRLVALFCWGLLAAAQRPPADIADQIGSLEAEAKAVAARWLQDERPVYRAWGAELAQRHHIRDLTAQLVAALGDLSALPSAGEPMNDEDKARLAILDALIQSGADAHLPQARQLYRRYPAETVILLFHSRADSSELFMEVFKQSQLDECWLAAGNWLSSRRSPGAAAYLLQQLEVRAMITVVAVGQPRGDTYPGGVAGGVLGRMIGGIPTPDPWPTIHTYSLNTDRGEALTVGGPQPVYYDRCGGCVIWTPEKYYKSYKRKEYLRGFLAQAASMTAEQFPIVLDPELTHVWVNREKYLSAVQAFRAEQEARYRVVVESLFYLGALTAEERDKAPVSPKFDIRDYRSDQQKAEPLPTIPAAR